METKIRKSAVTRWIMKENCGKEWGNRAAKTGGNRRKSGDCGNSIRFVSKWQPQPTQEFLKARWSPGITPAVPPWKLFFATHGRHERGALWLQTGNHPDCACSTPPTLIHPLVESRRFVGGDGARQIAESELRLLGQAAAVGAAGTGFRRWAGGCERQRAAGDATG